MEKLKIFWLKLQRLIRGESSNVNTRAYKKKSAAKCNDDFLSIETYSECGIAYPQERECLLNPNTSNRTLGNSILDSLNNSRPLSDKEFLKINSNLKTNYDAWVEKLKKLYGYKTKKALFRKMNNCWIQLDENIILIEPSYHERLEGWSGMDEEHTVKIPADSSPEDIGAALRLAFSRCKSKTF